MRIILLLAAVLASGCKSAEIAVNHQMTGLHVAAKFEAKEKAAPVLPANEPTLHVAAKFAANDSDASHWNGGEADAVIRR